MSTTWYGSYASDRLASVARWCCILKDVLSNEGNGGRKVLQETLELREGSVIGDEKHGRVRT